ncbi:ATP-binding protein [Clostridium sp.]|uniref:ATP-binding protein n=1 Tax=Clostridium sp. TaxID=1506 RepID=UPI003217806B
MGKYREYDSVPNAHLLLSSLRSVGYTEETAIADIIDNCLSALASKVNVMFDWESRRIIITDNGMGMGEEILLDSMKIGSANPYLERKNEDLGRFGMGMKTAAFSLGKRLTVVSKEKRIVSNACWDLEYIERNNKWKMIILNENDNIIIGAKSLLNDYENGTVVIIDKLDKLIDENNITKSEDKFFKIISKVKKHISLVFHRFIEEDNLGIWVNNNKVDAWDPFVLDNSATQELSKEECYEDDKVVTIEPYILPHKTKFSSQEDYKKATGHKGWLQHQGFYIYRNRRLLVYGTWFNILRKEISYNLARIKLDIDSNSDFDWQIDIKKSKAVPPVYIEELLEKVATICTEKSASVYNSRGTYIKNMNKNIPSLSYVWEQRKNKMGKYSFYLNRKHPLLNEIKNSLNQDNRECLKAYISLVENLSPIMMSGVADTMQGKESKIEDLELSKEKMHIRRLIDVFRVRSFENNEIIETLCNMASYKGMEQIVESLVEEE